MTRSGTTNGTFSLGMSGLSVGRHTVQMVAEMETDGLTLKSESVYMDILKRGSSAPFIGTKITHADGRIVTGTGHTVPTLEVGQYEQCSFSFVAYDPAVVPATVEIWRNGSLSRSVSVPRSVQTYGNRFTEKGTQTLQLKLGATAYTLDIDVTESGVDIAEASYGLLFKLGRCRAQQRGERPGRMGSRRREDHVRERGLEQQRLDGKRAEARERGEGHHRVQALLHRREIDRADDRDHHEGQ